MCAAIEMSDKPAKTYDFTIFWKDDAELDQITEQLDAWKPDATRLQVAREICPDTEREHLQCKVTWKRAKRWAAMKKILGPHVHFEKSVSLDFSYTAKLDSEMLIQHDGRAPGTRNDLMEMKQMIDDGEDDETLWDNHFGSMVRYHGAMSKYKMLKSKKRKRPECEVEWITGPSGSGKSTKAEDENPGAYWLNVDGTDTVWWDGYDGEDTVVIDDFRGDMFKYNELLKLLNSRGQYRIAFKGGSGWLHARKFVITSVQTPQECYPMAYDTQLERRITSVTVTEVR